MSTRYGLDVKKTQTLSARRTMRFSYVCKREIVVKFSRDYTKFDNKQRHKKISSPPKYVRQNPIRITWTAYTGQKYLVRAYNIVKTKTEGSWQAVLQHSNDNCAWISYLPPLLFGSRLKCTKERKGNYLIYVQYTN